MKLDLEPRLAGLPAALIDWARSVARNFNSVVDAIGNGGAPRSGTSDITTTLDGPAFAAILTADTAVAANSSSYLVLGTERFDTANCYNPATGRFTPNVAGYYQVNFNALFQFSVGGTNMHAALALNLAEYVRGAQHVPAGGSEGFWNSTGSALVYLNGAGDNLSISQTNSAPSGTVTVLGGYTQFSAHLARRA